MRMYFWGCGLLGWMWIILMIEVCVVGFCWIVNGRCRWGMCVWCFLIGCVVEFVSLWSG